MIKKCYECGQERNDMKHYRAYNPDRWICSNCWYGTGVKYRVVRAPSKWKLPVIITDVKERQSGFIVGDVD